MIDLHTHVLPGIDDGPATVDGSLELARAAVADGATTLVATPHVTWELPNDSASIAAAVRELQGELDRAGIALEVRTGSEIVITRAYELDDEELARLRLGGGEWLLAECPLSPAAPGFDGALATIAARGHRIALAHPERSPAVQRDPELLRRLVASGMVTSITAGSLLGRFGSTVQRFAFWMLEEDLVHNVASDAHDARRRPPGIREALAYADAQLPGVSERAEWLTLSVPAAMLASDPIPEAPGPVPAARRRRLFRRGARPR